MKHHGLASTVLLVFLTSCGGGSGSSDDRASSQNFIPMATDFGGGEFTGAEFTDGEDTSGGGVTDGSGMTNGGLMTSSSGFGDGVTVNGNEVPWNEVPIELGIALDNPRVLTGSISNGQIQDLHCNYNMPRNFCRDNIGFASNTHNQVKYFREGFGIDQCFDITSSIAFSEDTIFDTAVASNEPIGACLTAEQATTGDFVYNPESLIGGAFEYGEDLDGSTHELPPFQPLDPIANNGNNGSNSGLENGGLPPLGPITNINGTNQINVEGSTLIGSAMWNNVSINLRAVNNFVNYSNQADIFDSTNCISGPIIENGGTNTLGEPHNLGRVQYRNNCSYPVKLISCFETDLNSSSNEVFKPEICTDTDTLTLNISPHETTVVHGSRFSSTIPANTTTGFTFRLSFWLGEDYSDVRSINLFTAGCSTTLSGKSFSNGFTSIAPFQHTCNRWREPGGGSN